MYQKILICALVVCSYVLPVTAAEERVSTAKELQNVAEVAKSWQGTRYQYGGEDKNGVDCSHLVYAAYNSVFKSYAYRTAEGYLHDSAFAPAKSPVVGDVIVFPAVNGASVHIGIITDVRGTKFIGAQTSTGVKEASFAPGTYWGKRAYQILSLIPS